MGMLGEVILPEPVACPGCGANLGNVAQTKGKDDPYLEKYDLSVLHEEGIDQFYFLCDECRGWTQFDRKLSRLPGLSQFDRTFTAHEPCDFSPAPASETPFQAAGVRVGESLCDDCGHPESWHTGSFTSCNHPSNGWCHCEGYVAATPKDEETTNG